MEKKKSISIKASLYDEIKTFCETNDLKIQETVEEWINKQFILEKWGEMPSIFTFNEHNYPTQVNEHNQGKQENNSIKNPSLNEVINNNSIMSTKKRRLK